MGMATPDEMQQLRQTMQVIVDRAKRDPAYRQQISDDPTGTLTAAGIPAKAVAEIVADGGEVPEVVGHRPSDCRDLTCFSSNCPESCYVTVNW